MAKIRAAVHIIDIFWIILLCIFGIVLYSVIRSGYLYQIDIDELYHSQITYLIDHGNIIYHSFYTPYTPLFYWVLVPFFHIIGYGIHVLYAARSLMIVFFILRLSIIFFSVKSIFSWRAALFGLLLLISDPLVVMTGMQIRPDSLMMLLFTLSFGIYIKARKTSLTSLFFLSGIFMALSSFTLMKIVPSVAVFLLIGFISALIRKTLAKEGLLHLGFALTLAALLGIELIQGQFTNIIQQTFIDPFTIFAGLLYPVFYGFYYKEGNMWIYGLTSRSITWLYAQLIMPLSGLGIYAGLEQVKNKKTDHLQRDCLFILIAALGVQWIWVISIPSAFMQYFLTINWIIAVLAGIGITHLLDVQTKKLIVRLPIYLFTLGLVGFFSYGNVNNNIFRARLRSTDMEKSIMVAWNAVPENKPVFPSVLFRPIVYPPMPYQIYYTEIPSPVLQRYSSITEYLKMHRVEYIYHHGPIINSLPQDVQRYIETNFLPKAVDDGIYLGKTL